MANPFSDAVRDFDAGGGKTGKFYSLPALEADGFPGLSRLPVSIRILLESAIRNCGKPGVTAQHVDALARWKPQQDRQEVPLTVGRVVLQDFTGTALVCDLAAMRSAVARAGLDPRRIEPQVPVQLVIDHSVQINQARTADALQRNMELEYARNAERYAFFKWGTSAFETFTAVPPGFGIIHQVNLESLATGVIERDGIYFPDTLVGTDSHTTMINGIGVLGWGVGGIEAESAMLGQPIYLVAPDVVGVKLTGRLPEGTTITDAVLVITERLRKKGMVGKFVEFFGQGAADLTAMDRATIANMAPEYGATLALFPTDERTLDYFVSTGRKPEDVAALGNYYKAQGWFGSLMPGEVDFSDTLAIDLSAIRPSVAGPKRPQDRIDLDRVPQTFDAMMAKPLAEGGYGRGDKIGTRVAVKPSGLTRHAPEALNQGDILIAAITSCTNTSNPEVLVTAGLLAQRAVARGLRVPEWIKTSFAPGSRVVTQYLQAAGLLEPLEKLGFGVVAYGCAVCAGNSGPLDPNIEAAIADGDLVCAAVLSGNRNFEARIHPALRANLLMSPPLVIAYAIAGSLKVNLATEAIGWDTDGNPVLLKDVWPSPEEIAQALNFAANPEAYRAIYGAQDRGGELWANVKTPSGDTYEWPEASTYIAEPPFFEHLDQTEPATKPIEGASILAILGDSITTDHISPAGIIGPSSPAGQWLQSHGVEPADFNTYGARRGHHEVMVRGTFANVRLRNAIAGDKEGGYTRIEGTGECVTIFEASETYKSIGRDLVVVAGREYGSGSSRDWAAKGTAMLGVRAVIARSFERIHRSNLVGMGVVPYQFLDGETSETLKLDGSERISLPDLTHPIQPGSTTSLTITRVDGTTKTIDVLVRVDSTVEADYVRNGGVGRFILRSLLDQSTRAQTDRVDEEVARI